MNILINYPTVGADQFDPAWADAVLDLTGAAGLRVVLEPDHLTRNEAILGWAARRHAELAIVLHRLDDLMESTVQFARWVSNATAHPDVRLALVELDNEPWTMRRVRADRYAAGARAALAALDGGNAPIAVAMDCARPGGWFDDQWLRWWGEVDSRLDRPGLCAAIHPYRDGTGPEGGRRSWWQRLLRRPYDRDREDARWRELAGGRRLAVTEVGWPRGHVSDERVERWLGEEIARWGRVFMAHPDEYLDLVCVYAHHGPYGVIERDERGAFRLAPQGRAIRRVLGD